MELILIFSINEKIYRPAKIVIIVNAMIYNVLFQRIIFNKIIKKPIKPNTHKYININKQCGSIKDE